MTAYNQLTKLDGQVHTNFLSLQEQPNLAFAVVNLNFVCMRMAGWACTLSL